MKQLIKILKKIAPNDPNIYVIPAIEAMNHQAYRLAVGYLRQAKKLAPQDPSIDVNMGLVLKRCCKYRWSKHFYQQAINKAPERLDAYIGLGMNAKILGEYALSEGAYKKVLNLKSNYVSGHINLGICYLEQEKYQQGWIEYEWRLKLNALKEIEKHYEKPRWQGESLQNKCLIIYAEQGFGDAIQFIRFVKKIQKMGGKVIVECQSTLCSLLQTMKGVDDTFPRFKSLPQYDYYLPLLSLPYLLNLEKTDLHVETPYLQLSTKARKQWADIFSVYSNNYKIGICWAGNPQHKYDQYRSISPLLFKTLSKVNNKIKLFSLQKGLAQKDCNVFEFIAVGDKFETFMDTAACMAQLDLIISIDSSVLHLSAALDKPTWGLIAYLHDWRWGKHDRNTTIWYPSMRLYRQKQYQKWEDVFNMIKLDLAGMILDGQ
ncbi:MAG: hypothetical protein CMF49_00475 [Legionellales bacterium]|nr:hypothetical protein [Legionellales bacterium]